MTEGLDKSLIKSFLNRVSIFALYFNVVNTEKLNMIKHADRKSNVKPALTNFHLNQCLTKYF